jgi:hypothetical protein
MYANKNRKKISSGYYPAIPLLYKYRNKMKSVCEEDIYFPMSTAALFTIVKIHLMDKENVICTHGANIQPS